MSKEVSVERTKFSDCEQFRYTLRRSFLTGSQRICFVMLNPSTADAQIDDPTTRRAVAFAHRLDCQEYLAVNLFALRATDPKVLQTVDDPIGPENDAYLVAAAEWADRIVLAWGAGGTYKQRHHAVSELLFGYELLCLGYTKAGHPRFPLYLADDTAFETFHNPANRNLHDHPPQ